MNNYKFYGAGRKWFWPLIFLAVICAWQLVNRRHEPTPDERYGCTVQQQAPNGECR